MANFAPCRQIPIFVDVVDFERQTLGGEVFQRRLEVSTNGTYPFRVALGSRPNGNLITTDTLLVDRVIDHGCDSLICVPNAEGSKLELVSSSFRLVDDPNVSAPGWTQ